MAREFKLPKGAQLSKSNGGGGETKYPWADWFDGKLNLVERHEGVENAKGTIEEKDATTKRDYGVPKNAMGPKIKTAARRAYKVCEVHGTYTLPNGTKVKLENGGLLLKARDMTGEERAEEDLLREEEKAKKKTKKTKKTKEAEAEAEAEAQANGADGNATPTIATQTS